MNPRRLIPLLLPVVYLAAAGPPLPPLPPPPSHRAVAPAARARAQSPRAAEQAASLGAAMAIAPPPVSTLETNILEATFAPTQLTNLTAFFDATTNLNSPWQRQTLAYPANGGVLQVLFTNHGVVFMRAGYAIQ